MKSDGNDGIYEYIRFYWKWILMIYWVGWWNELRDNLFILRGYGFNFINEVNIERVNICLWRFLFYIIWFLNFKWFDLIIIINIDLL